MTNLEHNKEYGGPVEHSPKNMLEQQIADHIYSKQDLLYALRTESFDDRKKQQIVSYIFLYSFHDALQLAYHREMKQEQIIACMSTPAFIQKYKNTDLFSREYPVFGYIGRIMNGMFDDRYETNNIDYDRVTKHASLVTGIPMERKTSEYIAPYIDYKLKNEGTTLEETVDTMKSDTEEQAKALGELAQKIHKAYSPFISKRANIEREPTAQQYSKGITKTKEFLEQICQLVENKKTGKQPNSMLNIIYHTKYSTCLSMLKQELQESIDLYIGKGIVHIEQGNDGIYRLIHNGKEIDDKCTILNDTFLAEKHELIQPKRPTTENVSYHNKKGIVLDTYTAEFKRKKGIYKIKKGGKVLYKVPEKSFQIMECDKGIIYSYYAKKEETYCLYLNDKLLGTAGYNGITFCYVNGDIYWTQGNSSLYKNSERIKKVENKDSISSLMSIGDKVFFVISHVVSTKYVKGRGEDSEYRNDIYFDDFNNPLWTLDGYDLHHIYQYGDSVLFMSRNGQPYLGGRKIPGVLDKLEHTDKLSINQGHLRRTRRRGREPIETTEIDIRYRISKEQKRRLALLNLVQPLRTTIDIEAIQSGLAEYFADEKKPTLKKQFKASSVYKMFAEHIIGVLDNGVQQELSQLNLPVDIEKRKPNRSFIYQLLINLVYRKKQTNPLQTLSNAKNKSLYNSPMIFKVDERFPGEGEKFYQRFLSRGNPEGYNFFELEKPSQNMLITHYFPFCDTNPECEITEKHGEYTSVNFKHFTNNKKVFSLPISIDTYIKTEDIHGYTNYRDENGEIIEEIVVPESYRIGGSNVCNTFKCEKNSGLKYSIRIDKPNINNISTREYNRYKSSLKEQDKSYIDIYIRSLPTELSSFVHRVRHLPPKNRVESIESFVQNIFVFDKEYESLIERNLTFEKDGDYTSYMTTAQRRMIELKKELPENEKSWKHKLMAGSDMEYSLIVAQMLKEADIISGVVKGFYNPESVTLTGKDYYFAPYAQFPSNGKDSGVHILDPYIGEQSMEVNTHEHHSKTRKGSWGKQEVSGSSPQKPKLSKEVKEKIAKAKEEIKGLMEYKKTLEKKINAIIPLLKTGNYGEKYANFFDIYRFSPIHTMKLQIEDIDGTTSFIAKGLDDNLGNKDTKIDIYNHMRTMMKQFNDNDPNNLSQISSELTKKITDQKLAEIIGLSVEYMNIGYNTKKLHNYVINKKGDSNSYK